MCELNNAIGVAGIAVKGLDFLGEGDKLWEITKDVSSVDGNVQLLSLFIEQSEKGLILLDVAED